MIGHIKNTLMIYVDPDVVCIPEDPGDCQRILKTLKADLSYMGKQGKGVYNIVAWVDRFDTQTEVAEDDNYLGPVKIVVLPTVQIKKEPLIIKTPMNLPAASCGVSKRNSQKPTRLSILRSRATAEDGRCSSFGAFAPPFIPAASCRVFWRRRIKG